MPPKDYFPQDENMLKMIQNETNLQKKFEMCNTLLSSRTEVKNHVQIKHEQELKKAFFKGSNFLCLHIILVGHHDKLLFIKLDSIF